MDAALEAAGRPLLGSKQRLWRVPAEGTRDTRSWATNLTQIPRCTWD